jgi:hypothetical protein
MGAKEAIVQSSLEPHLEQFIVGLVNSLVADRIEEKGLEIQLDKESKARLRKLETQLGRWKKVSNDAYVELEGKVAVLADLKPASASADLEQIVEDVKKLRTDMTTQKGRLTKMQNRLGEDDVPTPAELSTRMQELLERLERQENLDTGEEIAPFTEAIEKELSSIKVYMEFWVNAFKHVAAQHQLAIPGSSRSWKKRWSS